MTDDGNLLSWKCMKARLKLFYVRFLQQLRRQHTFVANVQVLLAPVPDLPAGDLPFSRTRADRSLARLTFEFSANGEQVRIRSGYVKLTYINRQPQTDVESVLLLQSISTALR